MDEPELRKIIAKAQKLDQEAIGNLYDRYVRAVFNFFRYRVGDVRRAEDLTSELFMKMVAGLPDYRMETAPFRSWLFSIARNLLTDDYRRSGRVAALSLDKIDTIEEGCEEGALFNKELEILLKEAIVSLTPVQKEVILLRYFADLTMGDIAKIVQRSEAAVKMLHKRALEALCKRLGDRENVYQ